jgi:hypothetical protein
LQQKEKSSFEAGIDKEIYEERDLITLKVPLSMPYQISWTGFERVDGEITIKGVIYKYVKRKIEDGQLVLLCLPYYKKMNLVKAAVEFGNHGNDPAPLEKKGSHSSPDKNNPLNEYEENTRWAINGVLLNPVKQYTLFVLPHLMSGYNKLPGKPPEQV